MNATRFTLFASPLLAALLSALACCSTQPATPSVSPAPAIEPAALTGTWQGAIKAGGQEIRLVFHLSYKGGVWVASMDSPDQGAKGIPVGSVTLEASRIAISVPSIAGRYEGVVQQGAASIAGKWIQGMASIPLDLVRVAKVEIVRRPQDPVPPYPYDEREVRFRNEAAGITLAGTLTVPRQAQAVPAVVLVTGSGAQNRNEEIMNHRPFLVLADALTRRGIAVLRYDDRGVGESEGDASLATTRDLAGDALSAFLFLSAQPGVDPARVGIAGHSEGGIIAPLVASEHPEVAFIVLLAGTGVRGDEVLMQQSAAILRAAGGSEAQIRQAGDLNRRIYDIVLAEPDDAKAAARIREILVGAGMAKEAIDAQIAPMLSPWYRFFLSFDPAEALRKTRCPVLALNGTLDVQVLADPNLEAIAKALRDGGNAKVRTLKLEGLNHLFQHAKTGMVQEYAQIEETFSPEAMKIVADWILEQAARR